MPKRFLYTLVAFICAGALLGFTLTFDFGISHRSGPAGPRPTVDPAPTTSPNSESSRPFESEHWYQYNWFNKHGQLIRVFARSVTLKPQGVTEAEWPGAEIHLTPSRVLQIRSERGTFYAPDSQPQRGQFYGRTVLTLFEGPGDRPVKLDAIWAHGETQPQSPDIKLRVFIDEEARFDLELATLESSGPVHLASPRADFLGKGLSLTYNEKLGLITRLVVAAGQSLRLKTNATLNANASTPSSEPAKASPPDPSPMPAPVPAPAPGNQVAASEPAPAPEKAQSPQFYRVNFDHDVHVKTKDSRIKSDHLELILGTGSKLSQDSLLKGMGLLPGSEPAERAAGLDLPSLDPKSLAALRVFEAVFAQTAPPIPMQPMSGDGSRNNWPLAENLPMAPVGLDDVVVTWTGPFSVEPEEQPYPRLSGPDDSLVHFSGNIAIDTDRKENIDARELVYQTKPELVTIAGDVGAPVRIQTPKLGVLTGPMIVVNQRQGNGVILGRGSIVAPSEAVARVPDDADAADRPDAVADVGSGLPPGVSIAWTESVEMNFFLKADHPSATPQPSDAQAQPLGGSSNIRALKQIHFTSGVHVIHPRFDLAADGLSVALNDPDQGRQTPSRVQADGNARLVTKADPNKPDDKSQALDLKSDSLQLELAARPTGQVDPRKLIAIGHVHADQPDRSIDAGKLDIDVEPFDPAAGAARQSLSIQTIFAEKDVRIRAQQPTSTIDADHLRVQGPQGTVDIFGNDAGYASVSREDGTLSAAHILLTQTKTQQNAQVNGPGTFKFISRPSASAQNSDPATKPGVMTIAWAKAMSFDQKAGTAHFTGAVQSQADFGKNVSTLYGDDQQFVFVPDVHLDLAATQQAPKVTSGTQPADDSRMAQGAKMIKTVTATQNASFRAEGWNDHAGGKLDNRLTVSGPIIVFDSPAEQMHVDGPGRMLVEDYRTEAPAANAAPAPATAPAMVGTSDNQVIHFSGRGATLFTWTGSLVLSARHNQMTIEQQVQMVHRAAGSPDVTQLDCRRFVAQLEETGGLSSWLSPHPPNATLQSVLGTDDVRILAGGRDIHTDRLVYTGSDRMMLLEADPGKTTQMSEINNPNTFTSRLFRWDMNRNRVTVEQPGPSRISIPEK